MESFTLDLPLTKTGPAVMSANPGSPFSISNCCIHCRQADFQQGLGPRTFVFCTCCQDLGTHKECEEEKAGRSVSEGFLEADWFCSQV